jgi:hypothetical protein
VYTEAELREYLDEIRERVCTRCVERPPGVRSAEPAPLLNLIVSPQVKI